MLSACLHCLILNTISFLHTSLVAVHEHALSCSAFDLTTCVVSVPGKEDEEDEPAAPEPFEWTEDMDV